MMMGIDVKGKRRRGRLILGQCKTRYSGEGRAYCRGKNRMAEMEGISSGDRTAKYEVCMYLYD